MRRCQFCAEEIQDDTIVCEHCGRDVHPPVESVSGAAPELMRKCPFCAEEIQDDTIVCKYCGRDVHPPPEAVEAKAVEAKAVDDSREVEGPANKSHALLMLSAVGGLVIAIGVAVVILSTGGDDRKNPTGGRPEADEAMDQSSTVDAADSLATGDQFFTGTIRGGRGSWDLKWVLRSPVCTETGCTWEWADVTKNWTLSGSMTVAAEGSVSGTGDGWWGWECQHHPVDSHVTFEGSAAVSYSSSAPASWSLNVFETVLEVPRCASARRTYDFNAIAVQG